MDQLQQAEEANWQCLSHCLSIANATPSPRSLQPSTAPAVMSVFFSHLHCRTSTMAQVPTLVAKSLFNTMQLPLSNMKTLFWSCCNYLKQLSPPYASKGAKITQPIVVGYERVMEKVCDWFSNFCFWPTDPAEHSQWTIVIMVTVYGVGPDMAAYLRWFLCCS